MALFRPQRPLRLLSLPRAPASRTYAAPARSSTAPKPVIKATVPKPKPISSQPASSTKQAAPKQTAPKQTAPKQTLNPPKPRTPVTPKVAAETTPPKPKPLDPNSPEYKKKYREISRRWLTGIVALPIFLVTSYYLFDRLVLGTEKKEFPVEGRPKSERDSLAITSL